ncbi:hypothetical protein BC828DRAFT_390071 [Blastocladiella britannica]|nr:hypothetical protein BC828DRAFT_390071 [Blastocladiella britannica]
MKGNRSQPAASKLPARSVLALEVDLREQLAMAPAAPHELRARTCLALLNAIPQYAPTLGPMLTTVAAELELHLYSNELTLSTAPQLSLDVNRVTSLDRIPWFVLVSRLGEMRREEIAETKDTLADLQHKIKVRERDGSLLQKRVIALKQDLADRDDIIARLTNRIAALESTLAGRDSEVQELVKAHSTKLDQAAREKDTVELSLAQANNTIERLSVFKSTKDAADDQLSARIWVTEKRDLMVPDPQHITELQIRDCDALQRQLYDILNCHLDDLEASLLQIRKKREILGPGHTGREEDRLEIEHIRSEFATAMTQLDSEQKLLGEHKRALQAALARAHASADCVEFHKYAWETQRKYAVCMSFSIDGGKRFHAHASVPYCIKCTERVVVCPHMPAPGVLDLSMQQTAKGVSPQNGWTWTLKLPTGTTHVQFRRPNLAINIPTKVVLNDSFAVGDDEHDDFIEMKIHRASRYFKMVWHYAFNKRGLRRPLLPRVYTLDKLTRLMHELYEARWNYETASFSNTASFIEFFFSFMIDRYQVTAVAYRVIFEILLAFEHHQDTNTNLHLFVRHLSGSDSVLWKYLRYVAQYTFQLEPIDTSKFRRFLHTLYPARSEALYEQLELEQQGCHPPGTKLSGESVRDQVRTMLRRRMEPNIRGFTRVMSKYDAMGSGYLAEDAFLEALVEILPTAAVDVARQQYLIAQHDFGGGRHLDRVSVERTAQIAAFIFVNACQNASWGKGATADPSLLPGEKPSSGPPAMPMVWHLQDELGANSKLEPDDADSADVRRVERYLEGAQGAEDLSASMAGARTETPLEGSRRESAAATPSAGGGGGLVL